jgi:hypothetical protein
MLKAVDFKKTKKKYVFSWKKKADRKIPKMEINFKEVRMEPKVEMPEASTNKAKREALAKEKADKALFDNEKYLARG